MIKKLIAVLMVVSALTIGCGQNIISNEGKVIECYGLLDKDTVKQKDVLYNVVIENVVWSIILCETIVVPIWLVGFQLYCPIVTPLKK